jgi:hypothetical protein
LNGSILLGLIFGSGELLLGLLLAGPTFFMWAGRWDRSKDDDPAFLAARKLNYSTIIVLAVASILNVCSGVLGALFKPGFVGWYAVILVAGLVLLLAGTFLTIACTTVGTHRARQLALGQQPARASGSLVGKVKAKRCGICGENIPTTMFYDPIKPHVEAVHPEYSKLFKEFRKVLVPSGAAGSVFLVVADYSAITTRNDLLLVGANGAFALLMMILVSVYSLKLVQTKRRWKREHQQHASTL